MSIEKPRRLGRGLEALLSPHLAAPIVPTIVDSEPAAPTAYRHVPIRQIRANSLQPRKAFAESELKDLEASIRENGLLQPITVRETADGYELIAGERRLRAAQGLGWTEIPAIIKDRGEVSDKALLTLALVENLQRADLNPLEEADGYQNLITQFSLTQKEVAELVGKDRSTVANTLRLLALPAAVRRMVRDGQLSVGHARALLALGDDVRIMELAALIIADGLSVREVERRIHGAGVSGGPSPAVPVRAAPKRPAEITRIEEELRRRLQTDVQVRLNAKEKGELRIAFYSADDLERLLDLLLGAARETA